VYILRFLRNPTELKGIKNISLLRHLPPPSCYSEGHKPAEIGPHDLSVSSSGRNREREREPINDSPVFPYTGNYETSSLVKIELNGHDDDEPESPVSSVARSLARSHLPRHRFQSYDEIPRSPSNENMETCATNLVKTEPE
jgi:hypothetical protein